MVNLEYPVSLDLENLFSPDWSIESVIDTYKRDPHAFEQFVACLFRDMGYEAHVTPPVRDGGYDIELRRTGGRYLVECKCFASQNAIGRPFLQRLVGVNAVQHADGIICVTTSHFSQEAKTYAGETGVLLVDGDELTLLIRRFLEV